MQSYKHLTDQERISSTYLHSSWQILPSVLGSACQPYGDLCHRVIVLRQMDNKLGGHLSSVVTKLLNASHKCQCAPGVPVRHGETQLCVSVLA